MTLKFVVSSHMNSNLSGVAKFSHMLAKMLQVPCVSVADIDQLEPGPILLSLKLNDSHSAELDLVRKGLIYLNNKKIPYDLFFHTFSGLKIEYELTKSCRKIFCGNSEIVHALDDINKPVISAWCPELLDTSLSIRESELNVFSFGMAHKIQIKYYRMLLDMLRDLSMNYTVWISTAFHEKAQFGDFKSLSDELIDIFSGRIQLLGFLSDDAINYFLDKSHLFVAFFEKGVRANNTTVMAAMNKGCAILTNCDEYSPPWMRHRENILDIHRTNIGDFDLDFFKKLGKTAKNSASQHASWSRLLKLITDSKENY